MPDTGGKDAARALVRPNLAIVSDNMKPGTCQTPVSKSATDKTPCDWDQGKLSNGQSPAPFMQQQPFSGTPRNRDRLAIRRVSIPRDLPLQRLGIGDLRNKSLVSVSATVKKSIVTQGPGEIAERIIPGPYSLLMQRSLSSSNSPGIETDHATRFEPGGLPLFLGSRWNWSWVCRVLGLSSAACRPGESRRSRLCSGRNSIRIPRSAKAASAFCHLHKF